MKERNLDLDVLRGFATFCVVLGHAVQRTWVEGYENHPAFRLIYMFHMPLFVLLSGYTLGLGRKHETLGGLFGKARRLLWPTFLWSCLIWLLKDFEFVGIRDFVPFPESAFTYLKILILHPNFVFWFLYVILAYHVLFYLAHKLPARWFWPFLITIGILLSGVRKDIFGLPQIAQFLPFHLLGFLLARKAVPLDRLAWSLVLPAMAFLALRAKEWAYFTGDHLTYYLVALAFLPLLHLTLNSNLARNRLTGPRKALAWIGSYSLEMYLIQCLFLNIHLGEGLVKTATIAASAFAISLSLSVLACRFRITNLIFFGSDKVRPLP